MKEYIDILTQCRLFSGIGKDEISSLLDCLGARLFTCEKGEYVFRQGEKPNGIPVLVKGKLHIQHEDYWGNRSLIGSIGVGEMFGEAYAAPESGPIVNDVAAVENSTVLFFDTGRIMAPCCGECRYHTVVVQNLFFAVCEKNRNLVQTLGHMSKRTTREKLISYLSEQAEKHNSSRFEIPFNRQQLADFLAVDRSAMSHELGKMRDEGLIVFSKNRFELK